ncbi:hypothetical protein [Cellulophaga sp. Hel_I_12]|uniref:hypothetical protein n=1 Tax=Cellulophaga sp. Hel_I_12 TaxID=1249972 RepID=UPI000645F3B1|nr:hypothetical protein [Cellulophaga sp. Hel_I_12]
MLESLLFMFLIFVGGLFLTISVISVIVGIIKKSEKQIKIAIGIGIIPVLCFGLIAFWYFIAVPSFNKSEMEDFSGTYAPNKQAMELLNENGINSNEVELILISNGTYEFDVIAGIGLKKNGTWKTGGIDGMFEFYDKEGALLQWVNPSGSGENSKLSFEYQMDQSDWKNRKTILFVKK